MISIQSTKKSVPQHGSEKKDTVVRLTFLDNGILNYLEVGLQFENGNFVSADTLYLSHASYNVNDNKLTIENLVPKFKPFFTVKDYTFRVHKNDRDTVLTINYEVTESNIYKKYELDFSKL